MHRCATFLATSVLPVISPATWVLPCLDRWQSGPIVEICSVNSEWCAAASSDNSFGRILADNTDRMARDIQAAVRRPEEKDIVAFVPDGKAWAVTAASVPRCTSAILLGRKRIRVHGQFTSQQSSLSQITRVPTATSCQLL